jgi:hypothetical protein
MKHFCLLLLFLLPFSQIKAQQNNGTKDDGFLLKLFLSDGSTSFFANTNGGYGYVAFGGEVLEKMGGEVEWVRTDSAADSLGCDSVVNDLTGKFALVRRGSCEFGVKCLRAQSAGAKAVIVVNHYSSVSDDENTIVNVESSASVDVTGLQIPCIFICRKAGELIANEIDNGQSVTAQFVFPSLKQTTAAYQFATPLSQVDTLKHITVRFFNPLPDTIFDATVSANITEPDGNLVILNTSVASLAPRQDTLLFFPPYLPPAVLGEFKVVFSNDVFGETEDVVARRFRVTKHTWASDNGEVLPGGIPWDFSSIDPPPLMFMPGALYRTGASGGKVTHGIFGLVDAAELVALDSDYSIGVILYDADANDDGVIDFENNWENWQTLHPVGVGNYKLSGSEADNELIAVPIENIWAQGDSLYLKPRHFYYLCLVNDPAKGMANGPSKFSISKKEEYFDFPSAPIQIEQTFYRYGFPYDYVVIQRLSSENVVETKVVLPNLSPAKLFVFPNPAHELLQLELKLSAVNKKVAAFLLDWQGKLAASENISDFQHGIISFETKTLPSGSYFLWIRTEEGQTIRQVMICH